MTDVADYLGQKHGGWAPSAVAYGTGAGSKWIDIPICYTGGLFNYRISSLKKAGFSNFPATTAEFLEYAKATPGGLALGHASGDANWVYWCLWTHGGNIVDKNDKVILNSAETETALIYAKQLYDNMILGVASWNDASNNKAFLAGEIHWTLNGISIYAAATKDAKLKSIAEDMDHAYSPIGPIGVPTELRTVFPPPGDDPHQISTGLQSSVSLHDGGHQFQLVDRGCCRLPVAQPCRLQRKPRLDRRSQAHAVPRRGLALPHRRRSGLRG
jgi:multiple sugar transport system substrate-binding protein